MLEKILTGPNLMCLGVMIWSALMLRKPTAKSRRSSNREVAQKLQSELRTTHPATPRVAVPHLEVRRHDYDRDVAARVETTMALLDQWIAEADREIVRLEMLLEERQAEQGSPFTPEQRRMVVHLAGAGYSISEIAKLVDRPAEVLMQILEHEQNQNRRAA